MKCINRFWIAATVIAASASLAWAQDAVFFSTSNSLSSASITPGNLTTTLAAGQQTLYVWVTSVDGGNIGSSQDITPPTLSYTFDAAAVNAPWTPGSSAAINLNYNVTAGTSVNFSGSSTDGAQDFNPTIGGSNPELTVQDPNGLTGASPGPYSTKVWDAVSNYTYGTGPSTTQTNVTATAVTGVSAGVLPTADNSTISGTTISPTNIPRGLALPSSFQVSSSTINNTGYYNSASNAFLLGSVTFTVTGSGSSTLAIGPNGTGGIIRGGNGGTSSPDPGNLTSAYAFDNATITPAATTRLGDLTGQSLGSTPNGVINHFDIDQLAADIRNGLTYGAALAAGRNDALLGETNMSALVSDADFQHEVGSLVDRFAQSDTNQLTPLGPTGTHIGDVNLDGTVNLSDVGIMLAHWQAVNAGWEGGNVDSSATNVVNLSDVGLALASWQLTGGDGQFSPVPEPASLALLGFGGIAGLLVVAKGRRSAKS